MPDFTIPAVVGLYTWRTAVLLLAACVTATAGLVLDAPFLAAAGFFTQLGVTLWAVRLAKRRPDLLQEGEKA